MRSLHTYICYKCGKPFLVWEGGVVAAPLRLPPLCPECQGKETAENPANGFDMFLRGIFNRLGG